MTKWPIIFIVASFFLTACTEDSPPPVEFHQSYVLSRIAIDPISEFGYMVDRSEHVDGLREVWEPLLNYIALISCEGHLDPIVNILHVPAVIVIKGTRRGQRAEGEAGLFFGLSADGEYRCDGTDVIEKLDMFLDDDGWTQLHGPLFIEGQTADARVNLRPIDENTAGFLQGWVQVIGELRRETFQMSHGRLIVTWSPDFLHSNPQEDVPEMSQLDSLVIYGGLQPDVDVDGDGLERFEYDEVPGKLPIHISRCIDGDGTVFEGNDCPYRSEIVDGIAFVLLFRLQPAEFVDSKS